MAVDDDPWAISFGVLAQAAPIAFDVEPRWHTGPARVEDADPAAPGRYHATGVVDSYRSTDLYRAALDTDDLEGRSVRVEIRLVDDATVSVWIDVDRAAVVSQSFRARPLPAARVPVPYRLGPAMGSAQPARRHVFPHTLGAVEPGLRAPA